MSNFWGAVQPVFGFQTAFFIALQRLELAVQLQEYAFVGAGEGVAADIAAQRQHGGGAEGVVYAGLYGRTGTRGFARFLKCAEEWGGRGEAGFAAAHALCNFRITVPCQLAGQGQAAFYACRQ